MMIDKSILEDLGACTVRYKMSDFIFKEDDVLKYYYQITEGKIKLNNYSESGKEILHSIHEEGQSIGEYLLFLGDVGSPVNAIAVTHCQVAKLPKNTFFSLLEKDYRLCVNFKKAISQSLHFQHVMGKSEGKSALPACPYRITVVQSIPGGSAGGV